MSDLEINTMIELERGENRKYLKQFLEPNWTAYNFMIRYRNQYGKRGYKMGYSALQSTKTWREARALLVEWFKMNGNYKCKKCGCSFDNITSVLHHEIGFYQIHELFTPILVMFVCKPCHYKIHKEGKKK